MAEFRKHRRKELRINVVQQSDGLATTADGIGLRLERDDISWLDAETTRTIGL
jgi:hypothetical protein